MKNTIFRKLRLPDSHGINVYLESQFTQKYTDDSLLKTHYFNGRYENIYIPETEITAIAPVLEAACDFAVDILELIDKPSVGFWFNLMEPGHTTTRHRHDDDDELLSAVYYVRAKQNAGDLIIYDKDEMHQISPEEGMFVFFGPDIEHEVLENLSGTARLSIGMNFGVKDENY